MAKPRSSEYIAWGNMTVRARRDNVPVYEPWQRSKAFLDAMGKRPTEFHDLARKDPDLGWIPGNVGWVHRFEHQSVSLINQQFGRWLVLAPTDERTLNGEVRWQCICDCGTRRVVSGKILKNGESKSCGCFSAEESRKRFTKHGMYNKPEYGVWEAMLARCANSKNASYKDYGARGIFVCESWKKFDNFIADMGQRPTSYHTIERVNNDGPYSPANCRWATRKEQQNNIRSNRYLTVDGVCKTVSEWSATTAVSAAVIHNRLYRGWSEKDAVYTPNQRKSP